MVVYFLFLEFQLFFIIQLLELASAAGSRHRTFRLHAAFCRGDDAHEAGKAVVFLHLHGRCLDGVPDQGVLHEPDVAVHAADACAVLSHVLDGHCKFIVLLDFHVLFLLLLWLF